MALISKCSVFQRWTQFSPTFVRFSPSYVRRCSSAVNVKKSKTQVVNPKYDSPVAENPLYGKLLFSTEVDVWLTAKRGPVWLQRVHQQRMEMKREMQERRRAAMDISLPVALEYLYGGSAVVQKGEELQEDIVIEGVEVEEGAQPVYPYNIYDKIVEETEDEDVEMMIFGNTELREESKNDRLESETRSGRRRRRRRKEVESERIDEKEYEIIREDLDVPEIRKMFTDDHLFKFGTPNYDKPVTDVPCGGCGAFLHCKDPKLPGYIPSQLLDQRPKKELYSLLCQRCYVIKEYNVALKVNVSPEDYPKTLEHMREKKALVLLLVDLLDFPGSAWPNIVELLGVDKKIILVGNKIDMILPDSKDYVKRIEKIMKKEFLEKCWESSSSSFPHLVGSICVSARTGFNVEKLIEKIFHVWKNMNHSLPGDIYLVGSTNVGKSSLFNLLIDSDLCKIRAIDLVQKAITSPIPGTTLNLLKFPVTRPEPHFMDRRVKRVRDYDMVYSHQELERIAKLKDTQSVAYSVPGMYNITHTLEHYTEERAITSDSDRVGYLGEINVKKYDGHKLPDRLDPRSEYFAEGRWCYDTPGTVCEDQIINLLTAEEVTRTMASQPLTPRTYLLRVGHTVLLGGLARLDYIRGEHLPPLLVTVFCANTLPINIVETDGVEQFLVNAVGTELMGVPTVENVDKMPKLLGKEFNVKGAVLPPKCGVCDVVLSSSGWIMISPRMNSEATFVAYTPGGKGIATRPAFLPYSINQKGRRRQGSPAYRNDLFFTRF